MEAFLVKKFNGHGPLCPISIFKFQIHRVRVWKMKWNDINFVLKKIKRFIRSKWNFYFLIERLVIRLMCKFWPHNVWSAVADETETEPLTRENAKFCWKTHNNWCGQCDSAAPLICFSDCYFLCQLRKTTHLNWVSNCSKNKFQKPTVCKQAPVGAKTLGK